jgi:dTMP kinase
VRRGFFITIEGPEGSGKSTQAHGLCDWLKSQGHEVVHTREPGGTWLAEKVRAILLNPSHRISGLAELFLYEAARAQHVEDIVRPALRRGAVVVCDRYTDSTEAYQGFGRGLPRAMVKTLNRIATRGLRPDLTLLLDVPVKQGLAFAHRRWAAASPKASARARRGDRLERESLAFHRRVRQGFLALARQDPRRFRLIRWQRGIPAVQAKLVAAVAARLKKRS